MNEHKGTPVQHSGQWPGEELIRAFGYHNDKALVPAWAQALPRGPLGPQPTYLQMLAAGKIGCKCVYEHHEARFVPFWAGVA